MTDIIANIAKVRQRIQHAAMRCGRDVNSITLLAVSKTRPADEVRRACTLGGVHDFGENYAQEAEEKMTCLTGMPLRWHFIGPLQSNKTRPVAEHCAWLHSLDRLKIAERLQQQRPAQLPPLNVCIQLNIDDEDSKAGIVPAELLPLARALADMDRLSLRGLMVIPRPGQPAAATLASFRRAADCLQRLREALPGQPLDTLSMGMSADLELAIAAGSTMVRIGTDIFGARE